MDEACRRALRLWLEYDSRRRNLVQSAFERRADRAALDALLEANERLREEAITLTRALLQEPPAE